MSDLLKQAIADAKAVRATALANAKAALEEAFAPKLQSMLGEKLRQEVEGDSEKVAPAAPAPEALDAAAPAPAAEPQAPAPETNMDMETDMAMEAEEEMEEVRGTINVTSAPDGAVNSEIHSGTFVNEMEKASEDYKKVTKGHHTEDPQGQGKEMAGGPSKGGKNTTAGEPKAAADSHKASDDYKKVTAGHKTQDPQGASNEVVALEENEELDEASLEEILKELEASVNEVGDMEEMAAPMEAAAPAAEEVDEEINLDELLAEGEDKEEEKKDDVDEGKLPPGLAKYQKEKAEKAEKAEKHDDDKKEKTDESIVKENLSLKKEIEEYRSGIEFLRDRINEINLLNAKLLYTNKLFKSSNLTNEQKLKVIESFDLTKSVREAKIVYATLAESFNFGAKKAAGPVKASSTVKTITEGLASKAVASTKPTKPAVIAEGAEMANRFKKLAGIR